MYKLKIGGGVIKDSKLHIPNDPDNRHWKEYIEWEAIQENVPDPADPEPTPEIPEPTISELIDALEAKDTGDNAKWNEVRSRKRLV